MSHFENHDFFISPESLLMLYMKFLKSTVAQFFTHLTIRTIVFNSQDLLLIKMDEFLRILENPRDVNMPF